jgi:sec-independent protein translocase protein TatB
MFDIGIQELVLVFVVALLVFGPKRLPELARTMGKAFGQLRRAMFDIKAEVEREVQDESGQIKHDLPDWKQKYPFNQPPDKDKPEDMKGSDNTGSENSPLGADEKTASQSEPAKESAPEETHAPKPSEEMKDS